jgi:hypothetical protein
VVGRDIDAKMLILDRDLRWAEGIPVTLPYAGDAPDHGAYESGPTDDGHVEPEIPDGLRMATMRTATEPVVVTGFEEQDREDWHYYWNFSRQKNTDSRMDDTTAHSGERSMRVFAEDDNATLACDIRPRWWDIDRFPHARLAYRIPEGVPVGILLYPFPTDAWGRGAVYIAGGETLDPGGFPNLQEYRLIDDDQWHEVTMDVRAIRDVYPGVKLLKMLRFYTVGNAEKGQQLWFDDFAILPAEDAG